MIVCFTAGEHPLRTIYAILPVRGMRKDSGCEKFKWFPGTLIERREDGMWKVEYDDGETAYDKPEDMREIKKVRNIIRRNALTKLNNNMYADTLPNMKERETEQWIALMKENVIEIENGNRKRKRCLNCRERHDEKRIALFW